MIGVKDGATLAALWLSSEYQRYPWLKDDPSSPAGRLDRQHPAGLAITAAVWISPSPSLGGKGYVNVAKLLEVGVKVHKLPVLFIYGEGDDKGKKMARDCEKYLTAGNKKEYPFTGAMQIDGAEKLTGRELLLESKETTTKILEYLDSLPPNKAAAEMAKIPASEAYRWEWVDNQGKHQATARKSGSKQLEFASYASFLK